MREEKGGVSQRQVQLFARGGVALYKPYRCTEFIKFECGQIYNIDTYVEGEEHVELLVIGFTAHMHAKGSFMIHFWCEALKEFIRSTGENLMKHMHKSKKVFKVDDEPKNRQFSITDKDISSYYRKHETVLLQEDAFFTESVNARLARKCKIVQKQNKGDELANEQFEEMKKKAKAFEDELKTEKKEKEKVKAQMAEKDKKLLKLQQGTKEKLANHADNSKKKVDEIKKAANKTVDDLKKSWNPL